MGITGETNRQLEALLLALKEQSEELTLPLLLTLIAVGCRPGMSVNELAEEVNAPQQTASRYISILQGRYQGVSGQGESFARTPLLMLEVSQDDPRRRALILTKAGKKRLDGFVHRVFEGARE